MGATYKSLKVTRPGQSLFLATAAYEHVKPGYCYSLAMTTAELARRGIPFVLAIMDGNCHVDDGRNALVRDFLYDTQCTDLLFLDADLRWDPKMILNIISHDSDDVIAGAYPFKSSPQRFPVGKILPGDDDEIKKGLLSVSYAPTGFMRIPRSVFDKLTPFQTKRGSVKPTHRFFERRYTVNTYDGGDVTFCRKWIGQGGRVLIDSKLVLEHIGERRWSGCFIDYLAKDSNKELHTLKSKDPVPAYKPDEKQNITVSEAMQALEDGQESLEDFTAIADKWGNKPWASTPEYGEVAYKMAMKLPKGATIIECGSGFTSVVLAIAAKNKGLKHIVLEQNAVWRKMLAKWYEALGLNSEIVETEYDSAKRWYKYEPKKADLIVIDGPSRGTGADRLYPLKQPWSNGVAVIIDDIKSVNGVGGDWVPMTLGGRLACAGRVRKPLGKLKGSEV